MLHFLHLLCGELPAQRLQGFQDFEGAVELVSQPPEASQRVGTLGNGKLKERDVVLDISRRLAEALLNFSGGDIGYFGVNKKDTPSYTPETSTIETC